MHLVNNKETSKIELRGYYKTYSMRSIITERLKRLSPGWHCLYATIAAFCTYSCMYAVRKPFTVALFEDLSLLGIDYKIWLIGAQVLGYTISKFLGIKIVSEMRAENRAKYIASLIFIAQLSLLLFWIVPSPYNIIFLFINGLPLGLIWGLVFSYLEGRRFTELMGAGLSVSFILSSGIVKSVGKWLMLEFNVSEFAMPFITASIFIIPMFISLFALDCLPPPTAEDERLRTRRAPMKRSERVAFLKEFFTGVALLVFSYFLLMVIRDIRDSFSVEIWSDLGYIDNSKIFTQAEIPVAIITLIALASIVKIKDNYLAFNVIMWTVFLGFAIVGLSSYLYLNDIVPGSVWMVSIGVGLYLGYIPFNAFIYERLVATFKHVSNIGFIMYISDSIGYLGSFGVFVSKNFTQTEVSWLDFLLNSSLIISFAGMVSMMCAISWFRYKYRVNQLTTEQV